MCGLISIRTKVFVFGAMLLGTSVTAQSVITKFFGDPGLKREVSPRKAKFSETVSQEADGRVTTEVKDLLRNEIVVKEIYKGEEPFGIWFYKNGNQSIFLDYDFELVYSDKKFEENEYTKKIQDFFQDNDSLGYKAPVIASGEKSINRFVINNLFFPMRAREEGIQGKVYVGFKITEDAKVEEFLVYKGANKLLDKEAIRTIRKLRLLSPPIVKGEEKTFYLMLPISFVIQ